MIATPIFFNFSIPGRGLPASPRIFTVTVVPHADADVASGPYCKNEAEPGQPHPASFQRT